jgi:hypothetical protein
LPIGVVARSRSTLNDVLSKVAGAGVAALGVTADAADESGLRSAIDELTGQLGVPDVLVLQRGRHPVGPDR